MHIGIDASRAARTVRTGTENYSLHVIRALIDLGTHHTFTLYFNQPPEPDLFPARPNVRLRVIPFPRLWTHIRLAAEVRLRPPDVLFVPAHVLPLWPGRAVATVHDLGYRHFPQAHPWAARMYLDWGTRHNARAGRLVIADSHATREDLVRFYGVPADKIRVAYPGLRPDLQPVRDAAAMEAVQRRYGIEPPYVLYVGTLQPRKNLTRLIEAFAHVPPPHRLVLAGRKGWMYGEILRRAEELGIGERVLFPGYVPDEDLPALLTGAALFAFPSLYEGFGLPVLEAMVCGAPVVCSNTSSLPEVAGDAAILVSPTDTQALAAAMNRVLADEGLRAELVRRGRERAQRFTWRRCAETILKALEDAAQ
ncbi:MAG: glycosyltransferase family 1 protein [Anaerolineales bacterium]